MTAKHGEGWPRRHPSPIGGSKSRLIGLIVALAGLATFLVGIVGMNSASASPSQQNSATSPLYYTGQGIPVQQQCDANDTPYLQFNFTYGGNYSPTNVTLHGIAVNSSTENGGVVQFITDYVDPSSLVNQVNVTWDGTVGNAQLVISHGCAGTPTPTSVTPAEPMHSTPDCTSQEETVTPSNQEGVVWSPSGNTTLKPGDSVTYTASPADGYVFPDGAQTSWTFTNDLDTSKCSTGSPSSTPPGQPQGSATVSLVCSSLQGGKYYQVKIDGSWSGLTPSTKYIVDVNGSDGAVVNTPPIETDAQGNLVVNGTFDELLAQKGFVSGQATLFIIEQGQDTPALQEQVNIPAPDCAPSTSSAPPSSTPPSSPGKSSTPPATHSTSPKPGKSSSTTSAPKTSNGVVTTPSSSVYTPGSFGTGDTPLASTGSPYKLLIELGIALMVGGCVFMLTTSRRRQGARQH